MAIPPGFRFRPMDEEIITYYLRNTIDNNPRSFLSPVHDFICEVGFYAHNPQELIDMHKNKDPKELYFITQREGNRRPSRAAKDGFWRTAGKSKPIYHMGSLVGYKRALDYYANEKRTDYKVHEYISERSLSTTTSNDPMKSKDWVINKLYKNRGGIIGEEGKVDHNSQLSAVLTSDDQERRISNQEDLPTFHLDVPCFDLNEDWFAGLPQWNLNPDDIFTTSSDWLVDPFDNNIFGDVGSEHDIAQGDDPQLSTSQASQKKKEAKSPNNEQYKDEGESSSCAKKNDDVEEEEV